jgi:hypothetical protein
MTAYQQVAGQPSKSDRQPDRQDVPVIRALDGAYEALGRLHGRPDRASGKGRHERFTVEVGPARVLVGYHADLMRPCDS